MHVRQFFPAFFFPAHVGFLFSFFWRFLLFSFLFHENEKEKRRCTLHAGMASEEFVNFIPKDDRPANSRDANPLVTIWIIVDETTYKDPAPKTLDYLRQRPRFTWKIVNLDTLLELVHSIPHRLENVTNHKGLQKLSLISSEI